MQKFITKYQWIIVLTVMLVVNLVYYRVFWKEFIDNSPDIEARYGEVIAAEMSMEQVYQNIVDSKSPFSLRTDEFYPFGISFTTTDPGNGLYFAFLRPFMSTHQAMIAISMFSIIMSSIGMYILLRGLQIHSPLALILGLAFAYTTFLLPRAGHLTYFSIYVFPWFFVCSYFLLHGKKFVYRLGAAMGAAFFLAMALYHNSYYFVTLGLTITFMIGYYLIFRSKVFFDYIKNRYLELVAFTVTTLALLAPWIYQVNRDNFFEGLPTPKGWGGAITYSSDLFGYFIPSPYSRFLSFIATWMSTHFVFARGIFESFSYPGILFLGTFVVLGYLAWRRKVYPNLEYTIKPLLFTTFWIWILTLGPFLHVAGKWTLGLQEDIKLVIPLPFAVFHYLPFMANIRGPARLSIGFVFIGYIVVAYCWQWLWTRISNNQRKIFLLVIVAILVIDHTLIYTPASPRILPLTYYQIIKADPQFGTVLEIPSTIRDGFTYFGSGDNLDFIAGQMIHLKPIVNGYIGRIAPYKIAYTQNNPFLGYVGRLIDPNITNNGGLDRTTLASWKEINIKQSIAAINFLDLSYIILKNDAPYSATMSDVLRKLEFSMLQDNSSISLWHRPPSENEFLQIDIGRDGDDFMLAGNWYGRDRNFRWLKSSGQVLFKIRDPRSMQLRLSGASYLHPQDATIYINRQKIGLVHLQTDQMLFKLDVPKELLQTGINTLHIIAREGHLSGENILSAKFSSAELVSVPE